MYRGDLPLTPVSLPRLRQLNIFSSNSTLILEHLNAPSLTGPVVIFDTSPHYHILRSLPKTKADPPYLQGIKKLHLVLNAGSAQHYVVGFREDGSTAFYIGACAIGYQTLARQSWVDASIEAVAACPHFSRINSLVFATDSPEVAWDLWLPALGHLEVLNVACPRSQDLLTTLTVSSQANGLPVCPSLHSLALQRCGAHAAANNVRLMNLVLSRYRVERPIRKLKLQKDEWDAIQRRNESWGKFVQSQGACCELGRHGHH